MRCHDSVLVDTRDDHQWLDAGLPQHRQPARRRRPENNPGHRRMCDRSNSVTRCQLKIEYRSLSTG